MTKAFPCGSFAISLRMDLSQTFALTTSPSANFSNSPGPCGVVASLPIDLKADSYLTITFSTRGVITAASAHNVLNIGCDVDEKPAADPGDVQFEYPVDPDCWTRGQGHPHGAQHPKVKKGRHSRFKPPALNFAPDRGARG